MEKQRKRNISVRIDQENYEALCKIANQEYRTISGQVSFWIRQRIRQQSEDRSVGNERKEPESSDPCCAGEY